MGRALIIGCGGVAGVVIHKCCQNSDVFEEIMIASRTKSKCDAIKEKLDGTTATKIRTAKVDADNVDELCALIDEYKPDIVMNIALPYQDLTIMDACLKCGVNYMDTANYEPRTPTIRSGAPFTRSAARTRALPRTSTTPGSGHTRKSLRTPV